MGHIQANAEHVVRDLLKKVARSFLNGSGAAAGEHPHAAKGSTVVLTAEDYMEIGPHKTEAVPSMGTTALHTLTSPALGTRCWATGMPPRQLTSAAVILLP